MTTACASSPHSRCARHTSLETEGVALARGGRPAVLRCRRCGRRALGSVDDVGARRSGPRRRGAEAETVTSRPQCLQSRCSASFRRRRRQTSRSARTTFDALGGFDELDSSRRGHRAVLASASARAPVRLRARRRGALPAERPTEWARMKRIWTQGRWYRVLGGAVRPTRRSRADHRRGNTPDDRPVDPPRAEAPTRHQARGALWNLAVISSCISKPKPHVDVTETRSGDPFGSPLLL